MNLEFGVLWIEDRYSAAEEAQLKEAAARAGFDLSIRNSVDGSDLDQLAREQLHFHPFDLVLLDLNLGSDVKGDDLAIITRSKFRSTPILFYSGSEDVASLRKKMAVREVEGVFCAHRSNFVSRAGEIIADLALSLNRLSGMRGLAMGVVAETDDLCREIVLVLEKEGYADGAAAKLDTAIVDGANKLAKEFPELAGLAPRLEHRAVDSMKLFGTFRDLLKAKTNGTSAGERKDQLSSLRSVTRTFRDDVLEPRNVLGHAREERRGDGWAILDRNGNVYLTVQDFPARRSAFLSQLRAIREIHRILVIENRA